MGSVTTAHDIRQALHRRYGEGSNTKDGERWICLEEARSGASWEGNGGQCDFLAIEAWAARGHEVIGHEIKVSMSDWKRELERPEKAEVFARHCHRWYVVVPSELCAKIKHEVPPAWGLMSLSEKGRLTEVQKPEKRKPEPIPMSWFVGWLAQIDRQYKRRLPYLIDERSKQAIEQVRAAAKTEAERRLQHRLDSVAALEEKVQEFHKATGIDVRRSWPHDFNKLGELWQISRKGLDLGLVVEHLRTAADKLAVVLEQSKDAPGE